MPINDTNISKIWHASNHPDERRYIDEGDVRKTVARVLRSKTDTYTLLSVIANKEVDPELRKYVGSRKGMFSPWNIRLKTKEDDPSYCPGANDYCNGLWFSPDVRDEYDEVLKKLAEKHLGKTGHGSFPLVNTIDVHNLDRPAKSIYLPEIHIVQGDGKEFKDFVENLNGDEAYKLLKQKQSPQFYHMGQIDKIRELQMKPLIISNEWTTNRDTLEHAVNFLVQASVRHEWIGRSIDED